MLPLCDGKRRRQDRVKKDLDLILVDLVTDSRFASRILWKYSEKYVAFLIKIALKIFNVWVNEDYRTQNVLVF